MDMKMKVFYGFYLLIGLISMGIDLLAYNQQYLLFWTGVGCILIGIAGFFVEIVGSEVEE